MEIMKQCGSSIKLGHKSCVSYPRARQTRSCCTIEYQKRRKLGVNGGLHPPVFNLLCALCFVDRFVNKMVAYLHRTTQNFFEAFDSFNFAIPIS